MDRTAAGLAPAGWAALQWSWGGLLAHPGRPGSGAGARRRLGGPQLGRPELGVPPLDGRHLGGQELGQEALTHGRPAGPCRPAGR